MGPLNLFFDFRDLFRSPRLALSGKKIWVFTIGNLAGYIVYWIFSHVSLLLSGKSVESSLSKYGLYPCLFGNQAEWYSWLVYLTGILVWFTFILLSSTAVSRITLKQLKGNDFFSSGNAWNFALENWKGVILSPITISFIILFFIFFAGIFSLISSIPYIGKFLFSVPYIIYLFGAIFTIYTFFVFCVSAIYAPSIVGVYEEDTMGTVFHSYSITIGHPWRIILYHLLIIPIIILSVEIFSWFVMSSVGFINLIFGHEWFMGNQINNMVNYASGIVFPNWIFDTIVSFRNIIGGIFDIHYYFKPLFVNSLLPQTNEMTSIASLPAGILSISYFIIGLSIISYGFSILAVSQTLMFIIFKKKSDDDNVLLRQDEDEIENEIQDNFNFEEVLEENSFQKEVNKEATTDENIINNK